MRRRASGRPAGGAGPTVWSSALAGVLVAVLAACGGPASTVPGADVPGGDEPSADVPGGEVLGGYAGFPACEGAPTVAADPSLYRDEPQYGNAMELVEAVRAWASGRQGFQELWLDRDHNGWIHAGFRDPDVDIAALQQQVAQEFPGEGVVVVEVPYTLAELSDLSDRVVPALSAVGAGPTGGSSTSVSRGQVSLHGVMASPEAEAVLQEFTGAPLCVDAVPASAFVPEGDQPVEGDGWRLLGHEAGSGEAYRTGVATTDDQLAALWQESGLRGPVPEIDWQREIAIWFGAVYGSSCPIRLDGVVVDGTTVHGRIVVPGAGPMTACTDDANPHSFMVAVARERLPQGPFVVQLSPADPPGGAPLEGTVVDVDLSTPGARATDEQLHPDPHAGPQPAPLVQDGHDGMPTNGARYVWNPRPQCAGVVIGPIDGSLWRLADREPEWTETPGQELVLHPIDDTSIIVSSPGMDYAFVRTPETTCS